MLKDCFITVLRVVLTDTGSNPLHIGTLLLIFDFVDCIKQPADPGGSVFLLKICQLETVKYITSHHHHNVLTGLSWCLCRTIKIRENTFFINDNILSLSSP